MSLATEQSQRPQRARPGKSRNVARLWRVPTSKARWYWLILCILLYGGLFGWYFYAIKTQQFPGPFYDPLRIFGIISFVIVLITVGYTLRRRFVRGLPGKVQSWLWLHTWAGITAVLIAMLHENFILITHNFIQKLSDLTAFAWGPAALFSLIFIVVSGIVGRMLDIWQTHAIAREANTNGVGIAQAVKERILELEYTIERLSAGKSEPFKDYCLQALGQVKAKGRKGRDVPPLNPDEQADFQRAQETLEARQSLVQSLHRQQGAQATMRIWRTIHIVLATVAMLIIGYHGVFELLVRVFRLIPPP